MDRSETELLSVEPEESINSRNSDCSDDFDVDRELNTANDDGRILLNLIDNDSQENKAYPTTYYTFSAKERLLLIFVETLRREFIRENPNRKPLVLAVLNECGIQKFVSTTLRPTVLLYPELIDSWQSSAQFVADFIVYEPLENPIELVSIGNKNEFQFFFGKDFFIKFIFLCIVHS